MVIVVLGGPAGPSIDAIMRSHKRGKTGMGTVYSEETRPIRVTLGDLGDIYDALDACIDTMNQNHDMADWLSEEEREESENNIKRYELLRSWIVGIVESWWNEEGRKEK